MQRANEGHGLRGAVEENQVRCKIKLLYNATESQATDLRHGWAGDTPQQAAIKLGKRDISVTNKKGDD